MIKTITTILLSCFLTAAFAQEWNPNGDNSMKGNLSVGGKVTTSTIDNEFLSLGSMNSMSSKIQINSKYTIGSTGELLFKIGGGNYDSSSGLRAKHHGYGVSDLSFLTMHGSKELVSMFLSSDGKLGVGTTSPGAKLDVVGEIRTLGINKDSLELGSLGSWKSRVNIRSAYKDNATGELRFSIHGGKGSSSGLRALHSGWGASDLSFLTMHGSKELVSMFLSSDGKLGVGTTTPKAKLDVAGTIKAHEVIVEVPKGADFVFDQGYNLKPLSEVESFIKTNKHLPEVQSEKEMQANGLSVNEFQIKLLQKIEELTLYIIEQDKRIADLESKK